MSFFQYIVWDADPEIFSLFGRSIRYYGVLFAAGFLISREIMIYFYKKEGKSTDDIDTLTIYMIVATVIGARLGHVLFYEPDKYLSNPMDILKIWEGGLASHGAAIGILLALFIYTRYDIRIGAKGKPFFYSRRIKREGQSYLQLLDRIVIVVALTGAFIRFGNFMNSEIIGKPTESSFGVVFMHDVTSNLTPSSAGKWEVSASKPDRQITVPDPFVPGEIDLLFKSDTLNMHKTVYEDFKLTLASYSAFRDHIQVDLNDNVHPTISKSGKYYEGSVVVSGIARHPAQLYESITSFLLFIFLFLIWNKYKQNLPAGRIFGIFLILLFGMRFIHEFFKENQVAFENNLPLNMGQWLSIPLVLFGIFVLYRSFVINRTKQS